MDAEAWLAAERTLIDRDAWTPPTRAAGGRAAPGEPRPLQHGRPVRRALPRRARSRDRPPSGYRALLDSRILPLFGEMPLIDVTLSEIKRWRASLDPETTLRRTPPPTGCSARCCRPPRRRSSSTARRRRSAVRAPHGCSGSRCRRPWTRSTSSPTRCPTTSSCSSCSRRSSACARASCSSCAAPTSTASPAGSASPARSTRTPSPAAAGACPQCGRRDQRTQDRQRHPHRPRAAAVPADAAEPPARALRARPHGLLFPGDRTDHMSVRYLMDRYRPAREKRRPTRPHDPPPPPHRPHPRRPARRHRRRAPGPRRPRLARCDGDLPARHPRPRQGTGGTDRRDLRRLVQAARLTRPRRMNIALETEASAAFVDSSTAEKWWPFFIAISATTAQHKNIATWIGPSSASRPNSAREPAISTASVTNGTRASSNEGAWTRPRCWSDMRCPPNRLVAHVRHRPGATRWAPASRVPIQHSVSTPMLRASPHRAERSTRPTWRTESGYSFSGQSRPRQRSYPSTGI